MEPCNLAPQTAPTAPVTTLQQFYDCMKATVAPRRRLTAAVLGGTPTAQEDQTQLLDTLNRLEAIPGAPDNAAVLLDEDTTVALDLTYEVGELHKDLRLFEAGEEAFTAWLIDRVPGGRQQVHACVEHLRGVPLQSWISDRDGTVNNYCGRYLSSIQSCYNAVFLARFARACARSAVILTSAPLESEGMVDISVMPRGTVLMAGSKGRECRDREFQRRTYPVDPAQQQVLDTLNARIQSLLDQPENRRFGLIGSGFQRKFGQTTVARQDISHSIPDGASSAFLGALTALVAELDPDGEVLRIEDTGMDVEIILTVRSDGGSGPSDFDKGDGVSYLNETLALDIADGPALVCGDTGSDVPMVSACHELTSTTAVFVTTDDTLKQKVRQTGATALFVDTPDLLVLALNTLSNTSHAQEDRA